MANLKCVICGLDGRTAVIAMPCNHTGCRTCLSLDPVCRICLRPVEQLVVDPLLVALEDAAEDAIIHACASCPEDAEEYCVDCHKPFCDAHRHADHASGEIYLYRPRPFRPVCRKHRKSLTFFLFEKLYCAECDPTYPKTSFVDARESLLRYAELVLEQARRALVRVQEVGRRVDAAARQLETMRLAIGPANQEANVKKFFEDVHATTAQEAKVLDGYMLAIECRIASLEAAMRIQHMDFYGVLMRFLIHLVETLADAAPVVSERCVDETKIRGPGQLTLAVRPVKVPLEPRPLAAFAGADIVRTCGWEYHQILYLNSRNELWCQDIRFGDPWRMHTDVVDVASDGVSVAILYRDHFTINDRRTSLSRPARRILVEGETVFTVQARSITRHQPDSPTLEWTANGTVGHVFGRGYNVYAFITRRKAAQLWRLDETFKGQLNNDRLFGDADDAVFQPNCAAVLKNGHVTLRSPNGSYELDSTNVTHMTFIRSTSYFAYGDASGIQVLAI